jgi:3alpha(or 20beta)-hydroxysteroid dehydrogenase
MGRLDGKRALVTGGAQGMGAAHARSLIAEGARVLIGDVADDLGQSVATALGIGASYTHLDVTSKDDWESAIALAASELGGLDVLVNNAGIGNAGPLGEYRLEDWREILEVNLTGPFLGLSSAVALLKASAPSSVINISSTSGLEGYAGAHGYTASKFGLRGLTKSAALELAPYGVRVNSVHPGPIRTSMTAVVDESILSKSVPIGRIGEPEEVAALVVYLASDESAFSTGAEFVVDGGGLAGVMGPT